MSAKFLIATAALAALLLNPTLAEEVVASSSSVTIAESIPETTPPTPTEPIPETTSSPVRRHGRGGRNKWLRRITKEEHGENGNLQQTDPDDEALPVLKRRDLYGKSSLPEESEQQHEYDMSLLGEGIGNGNGHTDGNGGGYITNNRGHRVVINNMPKVAIKTPAKDPISIKNTTNQKIAIKTAPTSKDPIAIKNTTKEKIAIKSAPTKEPIAIKSAKKSPIQIKNMVIEPQQIADAVDKIVPPSNGDTPNQTATATKE